MYQYLLAANVMQSPDDVIRQAKQEWRRQYKRNWKRKAKPQKELRFYVTLAQNRDLQRSAALQQLRPTTYAKRAVLAAIGAPYKPDPRLLDLLQLVGMAVIATSHSPGADRAHQLLLRAETLLLTYLKQTKQ